MTEDPYKYIPAYISPLSHDDHATLGRIAVLWGHIDQLLTYIIKNEPKLSNDKIVSSPLGVKLDHINNKIPEIIDEVMRECLSEIYRLLKARLSARNHAMHGCWGYRINEETQSISVAARDERTPSKPLDVKDLELLERDLCECSRICFDTFWQVNFDKPTERGVRRFWHGPQSKPPEWLKQSPLTLDQIENWQNVGELPYLKDPYGT